MILAPPADREINRVRENQHFSSLCLLFCHDRFCWQSFVPVCLLGYCQQALLRSAHTSQALKYSGQRRKETNISSCIRKILAASREFAAVCSLMFWAEISALLFSCTAAPKAKAVGNQVSNAAVLCSVVRLRQNKNKQMKMTQAGRA